MYGTHSKNIQVLGQLNHRCGMTSQMCSFKIEQAFDLLQSENWFEALLVCVRLFVKLEVARHFICLTGCVWPETCNSAVCKISCPKHWYANVQMSVVTTPFNPSGFYHCYLLLNFLTIVNYRYIVVLRINGFICKKEIIEIVPLSFCGP